MIWIIIIAIIIWFLLWILDGYVQDRENFEQEMLDKEVISQKLTVHYHVPKEEIK